jgi:aspartate aminotransferase
MKDRTIVVNGQAKGYAMTGWRIGYIAAPAYIAKACDKLQGQSYFRNKFCSTTCYYCGSYWATSNPTYEVFRQAFQKRRDLVLGMLNEIPNVKCNIPTGAFYVFPRC